MTPSSSAKVTRPSIEDTRSPLRSLRALHENALSAASRTNIPPRTPRTSDFTPSQSTTLKSNGISFTRPPSTKLLNDTTSEGQPPSQSNKRKRDSEPHSGGSSQLREAQEMVEQKRAKIAARVPSAMAPGNHRPPLKKVTSLADLYAQLRRDSGATGQDDASNVPLTPKASQTANRAPPSSSPGHSSSPDPIALTEDDQEVVLIKHIRPNPSQTQARPKPMSPLINLAHLSQSLKLKASISTPPKANGVATLNGVSKSPDKPRKSMPDFAVVVNPPPRHATQKSKSREPDTSRPRDASPPLPMPDAAPVETPREKVVSKVPETIVLDTPSPTPPPRTRAAEELPDSLPEQGVRRSRRGITYLNGSSLTSEDIDALLDATPVPFDLTPSCAHLASSDGSSGDKDKEKALWWRQPAFEARVKADIQRTLRLLLPADPADDPPPPIGEGAGRWRAEMRPRQPRAKMWAERLEDAFGPGKLDRGLGRKPRRVARPASAARRKSGTAMRAPQTVLVNTLSYGHTHGILEPPVRRRSPSLILDDTTTTDEPSVVFNDITNADLPSGDSDEAAAWTVALLPLVKGKTTMDEMGMARTSDTLRKVELASDRGLVTLGMLKESALADTVRRLSELEDVPLGDTHGLRDRARTLAERWRETFGDGLLS